MRDDHLSIQPPFVGPPLQDYRTWFPLEILAEDLPLTELRPTLRLLITDARWLMNEKFGDGADIEALVYGRSWLTDQVLIYCWRRLVNADAGLALVAVGGYGRHELLPGSDVDLLLLLAGQETARQAAGIEAFITLLWDIGLEVGHSVRTLDDCEAQGRADITIATNLMEARLLHGDQHLFQAMRERVGPDRIWPMRDFFQAKLKEQADRHRRYHDAVYNLEPNVKDGPGGLRDAHMIGWVVKRHFNSDTLAELVTRGFLTGHEYGVLIGRQHFLWKVRFGLHMMSDRREDRLLFDFQRKLAALLGYRQSDHKLGVELFMKDYYRTIEELSRLNEMLLQLFEEVILFRDDHAQPHKLNRRFRVRRGFLETAYDNVFKRNPFALLELFLLMQQHPEIKGVSAATIRRVRGHLHLIDDRFRADIRARSLFMEMFRQPRGLTHALRRMNRWGVLSAYCPVFGRIVGQMQYDLFHVYTVDEHTLFVVRNLRRFMMPKHNHEFPLCSRIAATIPKPEVLYLAGFFHDIAKGRGGDHSTLGAEEAHEFCAAHGLSKYDQDLVAWLVQHHLLMSQTAQRRDTSDPEVVNEFARQVGDRKRLDHLYLLTVADIRGTSPTLWNNWKDALLKELYTATGRALRRGLENPLNREELIADLKAEALRRLSDAGHDADEVEALWERMPDEYYLRYNVEEVVWHGGIILGSPKKKEPRVELRPLSARGGSALFIYAPIGKGLFNRTVSLLEKLGLTVTDARVITSRDNCAINTYHILTAEGEPIEDSYRAREIVTLMKRELQRDDWKPDTVRLPHPRRLKHFMVETRIAFTHDEANRRTVLELIAADRPGLLSRIAQAFYECGAVLQNAKIATFGAQAEDVFYLTDVDKQALTPMHEACLAKRLPELLDRND